MKQISMIVSKLLFKTDRILYLIIIVGMLSCKQNQDKQSIVGFPLPAVEVNSGLAYHYQLEGSIANKYPILMEITCLPDGQVSGRYKYKKHNDWLNLYGTFLKGKLHLTHTDNDKKEGKAVEQFEGKIEEKSIIGKWTELTRKVEYNFAIQPLNGAFLTNRQILVCIASVEDNSWLIKEIQVFSNQGVLLQTIKDLTIPSANNTIYLQLIDNDGFWDIGFKPKPSDNTVNNSFLYLPESETYKTTIIKE